MMFPLLPQLEAFLAAAGAKPAAQVAGLLFARLLPLVVFTPLFGGDATPRRLRMGITILLTLALLPGFLPISAAFRPQWLDYAILIIKEALVGFALALFVLILFEIFSAFGAMVDLARGATLANLFDPLTQKQESLLAVFFLQMTLALFFALGGHRVLLDALAESLVAVPLWGLPRVGQGSAWALIGLTADLFSVALKLAAPVFVVLLLLDIALGLINRVAPQIQVFFLSLTIKGCLGLFVVLCGLGLLVESQFPAVIRLLRDWLMTLRTVTVGG